MIESLQAINCDLSGSAIWGRLSPGSAIVRDSLAARFGGRSCETAHRSIVGGKAEKPSLSDEYCDGGDIMRRPVSLFRDLLFVAGLLLFLPLSLARAASDENRVELAVGRSV